MKVFILCSGNQERYNNTIKNPNYSKIKQLININGEPLLHRTIRQLKKRDIKPIIVTHLPELKIGKWIEPQDRTYTISTLKSTSHLWDEKTIILLGDVLYTEYALKKIIECEDPIRFFGTRAEIFALVFTENKLTIDIINKAMEWSKKNNHRIRGKLWCLYRHLILVDPREHLFGDYFTRINDGTRDFDFQGEYHEWLKHKKGADK